MPEGENKGLLFSVAVTRGKTPMRPSCDDSRGIRVHLATTRHHTDGPSTGSNSSYAIDFS
jgi:hypothetical protein